MGNQEDIQKLKDARDKIAEVYKKQATDNQPDDGNLTTLNGAILTLNAAIKNIPEG